MSKRGWPHVDDPVSVGKRLKEARVAAGMSQRELSFPGCTAVYICRIERGDRVPSLQVLRELAQRVGVTEAYLAKGAEQTSESDVLLDADVARRLEQIELAEHLYTQVLEGTPGQIERARALAGIGEIDLHAGRMDDAAARLEEARSLLGDAIAEFPGVADALARVYWMRDEYEMAIGVVDRSLELARENGDAAAEMRFSVLLANVLIDSGSLASARELLGATLAKTADATDPILQARLYWSQSRLHTAAGNHESAARYARMALAAIELTDHTAYAARAHHLLAYVELERGNPADALELLDRGYALAVADGGSDSRGLFQLDRARALAALGRGDEAIELAMDVVGELRETRPEQAGRAYAVAADVYRAQDDPDAALRYYELAAELVSDRRASFLVDVYSKMAALLEEQGRKDEALEMLKRAVSLPEGARDRA